MSARREPGIVESYLTLGLSIGRHIPGAVDAYYGPPKLAADVEHQPLATPIELVERARHLLGRLDTDEALGTIGNDETAPVSPGEQALRRRWLRAQVIGLYTTTRLLAGEALSYADEVEACYGVRPKRVPEEEIVRAHRALDAVVPGSGPLRDRLVTWREANAIPRDKLRSVISSLAEDLRERTAALFGLPDGEHVEFELVENQPWSGFNYYLGDLQSKVAVNIDLPVLSTAIAHLVAHEAYPGHHTEHTRKEVGLVRARRFYEESIFMVGTPQCLLAEGLADLGLEVVVGRRPEAFVAEHLRPLHIAYEPEVVAVIAEAGEALSAARANAAFRLHEDGADAETVANELGEFGALAARARAKSVEFLMDPTWRSYISCYVEGLPLCRNFVAGRPERFERLISEQLVPADLSAA